MTQALRRHPRLLVGVIIAAIAVAIGVKEMAKSVPTGSATVQLMVDSPQSALADLKQDTLPLATRAQVFAQLLTSGAVLNNIAKAAGVPPREVTAEGPYSGAGQVLDVPTPSEARSAQLVATTSQYHFTFVPDTNIPLVTASVVAPTQAAAGRLASAVYPGLEAWLSQLETSGGVRADKRVTIRQLGDAQVGPVNSSSATTLAGIAAVAVLLIGFIALMTIEARRPKPERREGQAASTGHVEGLAAATMAENGAGPAAPEPVPAGHAASPAEAGQARLWVRTVTRPRSLEPVESNGQHPPAVAAERLNRATETG